MATVTKAIIPVAGWGTRRLPITKAIEKCMLPIGNRPLVDYVVQDCLKAGITDLYFVSMKPVRKRPQCEACSTGAPTWKLGMLDPRVTATEELR